MDHGHYQHLAPKQVLTLLLLVATATLLFFQILWERRRSCMATFIDGARKLQFRFEKLSRKLHHDGGRFTYITGIVERYRFELSQEAREDGRDFYRLVLYNLREPPPRRPHYHGHATFDASRDERLLKEVFPRVLELAELRDGRRGQIS